MGMMDILGKYAEERPLPLPPPEVEDDVEHDFDEVAHEAGPDAMQDGIAEAFRSEDTPPFEEMVAHMFDKSEPHVRAGLLDNLLAGLDPTAHVRSARSGMADVWRRYAAGARVDPDRAAAVSRQEVQDVARQARKQNPGVLERVSRFYARHPDLVRTLGNVAMGIALSKMARRNTQH